MSTSFRSAHHDIYRRADPNTPRVPWARTFHAAERTTAISAPTPADKSPLSDAVPEADAVEQELPADGSGRPDPALAELRFREAAEADLAEQQRGIVEHDDLPFGGPFDADPLDAADQHRPVPLDDEDYR
jgi:hypothetical protein